MMKQSKDRGFYVFLEVSEPFQKKPGYFNSPYLFAAYWLFFAVGVYKLPRHEMYKLTARGITYWKEAEE